MLFKDIVDGRTDARTTDDGHRTLKDHKSSLSTSCSGELIKEAGREKCLYWHSGVASWHSGVASWHTGVASWHSGVASCHSGVASWHSGVASCHSPHKHQHTQKHLNQHPSFLKTVKDHHWHTSYLNIGYSFKYLMTAKYEPFYHLFFKAAVLQMLKKQKMKKY